MILEDLGDVGRARIGSCSAENTHALGWVTRRRGHEEFLTIVKEPLAPGNYEVNCSPLLKQKIARAAKHEFTRQQTMKNPASEVQDADLSSATSNFGLLGSRELRALAQEHTARAESIEKVSFETFGVMLGRAFNDKVDSRELVDSWDRNRNGFVTRFEFVTGVMRTLGLIPNGPSSTDAKRNAQYVQDRTGIEALFDELDLDNSGELDPSEIRKAFKTLADKVRVAEKKQQNQYTVHGAARRAVAHAYENAAADMEALEQAEKSDAMKERNRRRSLEVAFEEGLEGMLEVQLAYVLKSRNLKASDLLREWDDDRDGTIGPKEFHKQLNTLGLAVQRAASDGLFKKLDGDNSGELEPAEVHTIGEHRPEPELSQVAH